MLVYVDKQGVRHVLRIVREHDTPGFLICENQDKKQLTIHRSDIYEETDGRSTSEVGGS